MGCCCFRRSALPPKKGAPLGVEEIEGQLFKNIRSFSLNELKAATNNFHLSNKIGRGGFGTVYKGTLKGGGQVAVKALSAESKQGVREFLAEINLISSVEHPNLVALIGCCVDGNNGDHVNLDWRRRSAICLGTARGLAYLHEELVPHIVHRDIKASNILLDKDFRPKIGDFGLAKLFPENITHISTRIAGTNGYLAPEYAFGGHLTMKADVYSFGILVLEIISRRSSSKSEWDGSQKLLLEWAWELYQEGGILELVDPNLKAYPEEEVIRYMKVAFFCTQAAASRRPLMSQVVDMLSRNTRINEKQITPPGFFPHSGNISSKKMSDGSGQMSMASVTMTQVTPR